MLAINIIYFYLLIPGIAPAKSPGNPIPTFSTIVVIVSATLI